MEPYNSKAEDSGDEDFSKDRELNNLVFAQKEIEIALFKFIGET